MGARVKAGVLLMMLVGASLLGGCGQSPEQAGKEMEPPSQAKAMEEKGYSEQERGSVDARGH